MRSAAATTPIAQRREVTWEEALREPCISVAPGTGIRELIDRTLASRGKTLAPAYEVAFLTTALSMTAMGLGISITPGYLVAHLQYPMLVAVHPAQSRGAAQPDDHLTCRTLAVACGPQFCRPRQTPECRRRRRSVARSHGVASKEESAQVACDEQEAATDSEDVMIAIPSFHGASPEVQKASSGCRASWSTDSLTTRRLGKSAQKGQKPLFFNIFRNAKDECLSIEGAGAPQPLRSYTQDLRAA